MFTQTRRRCIARSPEREGRAAAAKAAVSLTGKGAPRQAKAERSQHALQGGPCKPASSLDRRSRPRPPGAATRRHLILTATVAATTRARGLKTLSSVTNVYDTTCVWRLRLRLV